MRTHRPDDMDATGPIPLPGAYLRDAGRRRITGATAWSAIGGAALAVTFGALFAQASASADAQNATVEPDPVAITEPAAETTPPAPAPRTGTARTSTAHAVAPKPAAPRSAVPQTAAPKPAAPRPAAPPAAPKIAVNPTDEADPPAALAPPPAAPLAAPAAAAAHASSGAT